MNKKDEELIERAIHRPDYKAISDEVRAKAKARVDTMTSMGKYDYYEGATDALMWFLERIQEELEEEEKAIKNLVEEMRV